MPTRTATGSTSWPTSTTWTTTIERRLAFLARAGVPLGDQVQPANALA